MGNGMLAVIAMAISFVLFHSLSMEDMGIWVFTYSIIAFCEAGRSGFLYTAAVKFYAGTEPERGKTVLGSIWYLAIIVTGIIVLLNICLLPFLSYTNNKEFTLCIQWVGISFLATLPSDVISWRLQAEEKYGTMLGFRILNSICSIVCFTILILFHEMTLEKAFFFNFLINVATSIIGIMLNLGGIKYIKNRTKECITEIVHYGKYTFGSTLGATSLGHIDTWILNFTLGPKSVAIYNLAKRFIAVVDILLRSFAVTCMSEMAIAFNKGNLEHVTNIFKKYAGMLTMAFIPLAIGALFLGDFAIDLLGGKEYYDTPASKAFILIMFIAIIYPMETLNGVTLDIIHKTEVNFKKMVFMIIVKVVTAFAGVMIFHNVYGVVCSIFLAHGFAVLYGNHQLQKSLTYTIPGIIATGYREVKELLERKLKISKRIHNIYITLMLDLPFYYDYYISCVPELVELEMF
ncbi:MAG: polysaccharide biosynthesis protein [Flavipsychrobacter sp.]|nr:polysaccharide biosynthesis protein [Flavipsychrobacter sp.]